MLIYSSQQVPSDELQRIGIPREAVEECPFQGPFLNGEQLDKLEASGTIYIAAQAGIQEDDLGGIEFSNAQIWLLM